MSGGTIEEAVPLPASPREVLAVRPSRKAPSAIFDRLGAVLGFACAIHCMVVPLLLGVLPALGLGFLADEAVDHTIVAIATASAAIAAVIGWRAHHDARVVLCFGGSVALLFVAHAVGEGTAGARALSVAGGIGLALTHLWNTRRSRSCELPGHAH
jgi:hypothetical protein